jgi:ribosomal protein S18 acetylase RimI-like enzyme
MDRQELYVHPDNQAAIKLYERFQFQRFHQSYTDPTSNITYLSYIFPLVRD